MGIYPQPCAVNETESGGSKLVPIVSTFDYSIIDADTASLAKSAADRIRSRNAKMVELIIATGLDLIEIKKRLLETDNSPSGYLASSTGVTGLRNAT